MRETVSEWGCGLSRTPQAAAAGLDVQAWAGCWGLLAIPHFSFPQALSKLLP